MSNGLPAVFLDTDVFDKHGRDFSCKSFCRLIRLVDANELELFLTTVNEQEIRSHLDKDARDAFKSLHNYRRASKFIKRVLPDPQFTAEDELPYRKKVQSEFDAFLERGKFQIISIDSVSAESVFKDYFASAPPFATGEKKSEFPDAFAISAIGVWSEMNDRQVLVVSGDKDWLAVFKGNPAVKFNASIEALMEQFVEAEKVAAIKELLESHRELVTEMLLRESENLEFILSDSLWNGELGCCSIDEVDFDDFHVIEAENGVAEVSIFCVLKVTAEVSADDSMSAWRDPDTNDVNCVWQLAGEVESEFDTEATITLKYSGEIPESCKIAKVEFDSKEVYVDADENGLSRVGEEENIEDYFNHFDSE
jgi:hypothetical protein